MSEAHIDKEPPSLEAQSAMESVEVSLAKDGTTTEGATTEGAEEASLPAAPAPTQAEPEQADASFNCRYLAGVVEVAGAFNEATDGSKAEAASTLRAAANLLDPATSGKDRKAGPTGAFKVPASVKVGFLGGAANDEGDEARATTVMLVPKRACGTIIGKVG